MIDIQLDDRDLREALDRLQRRLSDLSPVMRDIGELLVERSKPRFATSTDPDGATPRTRGSTQARRH
ncbi:MAG: phage virion morphogenesis protein [Tepidimonas sp.]|uniref:phage virion morphogenesis protein n=1 Tax=Tepidimonas sp. TaxID=2002775 RepID=UPI00259F56FD|nr:phage virion morphogenesis protein [Tepidimonas sp.]MDM7455770.1 phage virion morphogenesis protein [Tepidimonas sp.]